MNCFGSRKKNSYTVSGDASNTEESNQKNGKSKEKKNPNDDEDHKVQQVTEEATDGVKTIKENSATEGSGDQNVDDDKANINTTPDIDKDKKDKKLKKKEELENKKEKKEKEKKEKTEKKEKKEKEKKKGSTENLDNKKEKEKKKGSTENLDNKKEKKDKKSKKNKKSENDEKGEVNGAGPDAGLTAEDDCRSVPEVGLVPEEATDVVLVPGDVETEDRFDAGDPDGCHQIGNRSDATTERPDLELDAKEAAVSHQHAPCHAETCQPEDDYDARDDVKDDGVIIRDDDAVNGQPEDEEVVGSTEGNGDVSSRNSLNEECSDHDQETGGQGHEGQGHEGQGRDGQQRLTEMMQ